MNGGHHLMVVLSNSKAGLEDEFNDWYSRVHIFDTVNKLDGFIAGQRFVQADLDGAPTTGHRYLAIYEIPEDSLATAYESLLWGRADRAQAAKDGRAPAVPVSDALDTDTFLVGFFSPMGEPVLKTTGGDSA